MKKARHSKHNNNYNNNSKEILIHGKDPEHIHNVVMKFAFFGAILLFALLLSQLNFIDFGNLSGNDNKLGMAFSNDNSAQLLGDSPLTIRQYLLLVSDAPSSYVIVIGRNATSSDVAKAAELAGILGVSRTKFDDEVNMANLSNAIIVGALGRNRLLTEIFNGPDSKANLISNNNLRVVGKFNITTVVNFLKLFRTSVNPAFDTSCAIGYGTEFTACIMATCGNYVVEAGEQCDDGDMNNTNLCTNNCTINTNPFCTDALGFNVNVRDWAANYSNGVLLANLTDYCLNTTHIREAYCYNSLSYLTQRCPQTCLNGACVNSTSAGCAVTPSFITSNPSAYITNIGSPSVMNQSWLFSEAMTACSFKCNVNRSFHYDWSSGRCVANASVCGNGIIETPERCDDGNVLNNDSCSSMCYCQDLDGGVNPFIAGIAYTYGITSFNVSDVCTANSTKVIERFCNADTFGGVIIPCQNGCLNGACVNSSTPNCTNECSIQGQRRCLNNGTYQTCAFNHDADSCNEWGGNTACTSGSICSGPGVCSFNSTASVCGNGIIETPERCDDGNVLNNDSCSSMCYCQDLDGGVNPFIAGIAYTYGITSFNVSDVCTANSTKVIERFCNADTFGGVIIPCQNGCLNGACVNVTSPVCAVTPSFITANPSAYITRIGTPSMVNQSWIFSESMQSCSFKCNVNGSFHYDWSSGRCVANGSVCGNGIIETGEACDGSTNGYTCSEFGNFTGGTLRCTNCQFDVGNCTSARAVKNVIQDIKSITTLRSKFALLIGKLASASDSVAGVDIAGSTGVDRTLLDQESTNAIDRPNRIIIGGPCVNSESSRLLGIPMSMPGCYQQFPVLNGQAIIATVMDGSNEAIIVAGYSAEDTRRAGRMVVENPNGLSSNYIIIGSTTEPLADADILQS